MGASKVNDWLRALAAELDSKRQDEVPKGFLTRAEARAHLGCGTRRLSLLLREGIAAGRIERRVLRRMAASGKILPIPYYGFRHGKRRQ